MTSSKINKATGYAVSCHADVNHLYDGHAYSTHLTMVAAIGQRFLYLIPEAHRENVLCACWVHDVIEDCRETYNDVKAVLGVEVAELAYALTNEKGKSRTERANDKYYEGIRNCPYASFVKLCDRIANATYSVAKRSRMAAVYKKENDQFLAKLQLGPIYQPMIDHLNSLLENVQ